MQEIQTNQIINCELTNTATRSKTFQWLKSFHWVLKQFEWFLWKYWSIKTWKKRKVLIAFDDMVAYVLKKFLQVVTDLFTAARKWNISLTVIFYCSKKYMLISTHYFIMEIPNLYEQLQQIIFNYSSDIDYYDFMRICRRWTNELYFVLVTSFKKNLVFEISQNKLILSQLLIIIMTIDETNTDEKLYATLIGKIYIIIW